MVALQFIKAHFPDIQIDWIVEKNFLPILEHNPDINAIYPVNLKALKKDKKLFWQELNNLRQISKNNYDLVIDAQGLIKSAIVSKLIGQKIAGFNKNSAREKLAACLYSLKIECPYHENTIDRNAKILSAPLNFSISAEQIETKKVFLFFQDKNPPLNNYFSKQQKNILFVIGSTWESRNYPKEKFLEIAEQLQQNFLVVWGNDIERQKAQWLAEHSSFIQILPKLDLNDLKAVISKADLVIGNDTGPTHLAWGLNTPAIILFGCTPISRVYQTKENKVLKSSSVVNPYKLNKNDYSIAEIEVSDVLNLAAQLLDKNN
jgi:heptosyltransferase-1